MWPVLAPFWHWIPQPLKPPWPDERKWPFDGQVFALHGKMRGGEAIKLNLMGNILEKKAANWGNCLIWHAK
jgi:hypothetical protein